MICGEPQAQVVPPSEATSTRQVATAAIRNGAEVVDGVPARLHRDVQHGRR